MGSDDAAIRALLWAGLDDWISLDEVTWEGAHGDLSAAGRAAVRRLLDHVYREGLLVPGDLGESGFEDWTGSATRWLERSLKELDRFNWKPMGAGFWLRLSDEGEAPAREGCPADAISPRPAQADVRSDPRTGTASTPRSPECRVTRSTPASEGSSVRSDFTEVRPARIRYRTTEEGGRLSAPVSGVRSQIALGQFQSSCVIESSAGLDVLPLGEEVEVRIRLLSPEHTGATFIGATSVKLFEGNKLVATGSFLDGEQDTGAP
ncbi:hypothetical protein ACFT5B_00205 [Luteimicrobium sp. NPDC057192]|uniref:hypothetical protein n=1 Tax=Luteimicrobium sp. NPDC057192 TaxID=3346042 RepID=UPI00363FA9B9